MSELQHQYAFEKKGPGSAEWELHRQEIVEMYSQCSLEEVRERMLKKHGFAARYNLFPYNSGHN
jgi:hypothetical protein